MLSSHAKASCRLHVGSHCLDLPASRNISLVVSLIAAVALLAVASLAVGIGREWTAGRDAQVAPALRVGLTAPRVPARPVDALERIDLSTVVTNPGDRALENVSLELAVLQSDGTRVLSARQSHLALQPHDARAVYWSWRVPAQLGTGEYGVEVRAFDANGRLLSGDQPASAPLRIVGRTN